jgi:hypothetical protein
MRKLLVVLSLLGSQSQAQTVWFTVMGNPDDAALNTIQVDPKPEDSSDGFKTMRLRVNRSEQRTSWDGVPYRSYEARVLFDCPRKSAKYLSIAYHSEPQWRGTPYRNVDYTKGPVRPMLFKDVEPNPTARIVRAACGGNG